MPPRPGERGGPSTGTWKKKTEPLLPAVKVAADEKGEEVEDAPTPVPLAPLAPLPARPVPLPLPRPLPPLLAWLIRVEAPRLAPPVSAAPAPEPTPAAGEGGPPKRRTTEPLESPEPPPPPPPPAPPAASASACVRLSSQMCPPLSSTIFLQMERPRPVPPPFCSSPALIWLKGWKSFAWSAALMPGPQSDTEKRRKYV